MAIKYRIIAEDLQRQILFTKSLVPYKLPTEKELCAKYNVSRQTVRQALRLLVQEKLISGVQGSGFYTIPLAEHLKEKKIVLMISDDNEYIYPAFISNLKKRLRESNLSLIVAVTQNDYNEERLILEKLQSESASILLVEGCRNSFPNPNLDLYEKLQLSGTHIMFINFFYPQLTHAARILSNDYEGGYLLGEHFISAGRQNVICILPDYDANSSDRYSGMLAAYRDHKLPLPSSDIFWYTQRDISALRQKRNTDFLITFICSHYQSHDAILCYNDEIAYWLITELSYRGIQIPEDVTIAAFDNSYLATMSTPALTSLAISEKETQTHIMNFIEDCLFNEPPRSFQSGSTAPIDDSIYNQFLSWKLIVRDS